MKKLYFLNEEEKNRILNLHENATKRQYLGEQTEPLKWVSDPTGNKTWEYQFKDGKWWARKIGQTKEFDISTNAKYVSSVNHLNKAYPEAIKPVTSTTTNTTPVNTVVGGDPNSEVAKKTAEANASTSVASNTTPSSSQNAQPATGGTNFTEVDDSEFS
jgi:hypothetical protein